MPSRERRKLSVGCHEASPTLLHRVRNMWQFANFCQWLYIFGRAVKIPDSVDVEMIEAECLKPDSTLLAEIGLSILKLVSTHRGLTHEIFDGQMRKEYLSKLPAENPFGDDESPRSFSEFDVLTKFIVLQQLTQWAMLYPERIREKMEEQKDTEQTSWRIEPYGWDREDRTYYVLDDNRVYRLSESPTPQLRPKQKKSTLSRNRRRRGNNRPIVASRTDNDGIKKTGGGVLDGSCLGLGGRVWECVAVTLQDVHTLLGTFERTRDENEKILRKQLEMHLVPILERQEESQKRKQLQRERELLNLEKLANAKRSSRIASRAERKKQEAKEKEEEKQRNEALAAERREEQERQKSEKERDFRIHSRQRRLKDREARRLRYESELAQLSQDSKTAASASGRVSERRLQVEIERNLQALKDLQQEEEDWVFDCICGLRGKVDDGEHCVACDECCVWQHSKCLGIAEDAAERPDFHFTCETCKRHHEGTAAVKSTIRLKLNPTGSSIASAGRQSAETVTAAASDCTASALPEKNGLESQAFCLQHRSTAQEAAGPNMRQVHLTSPVFLTVGTCPANAAPGLESAEASLLSKRLPSPVMEYPPQPKDSRYSVKGLEATVQPTQTDGRNASTHLEQ